MEVGGRGGGQIQTQVVWLQRMCEHEQVSSSLTLGFLIYNMNITIPILQDWKQKEMSEDSQTFSMCMSSNSDYY